MKLKQMLLGLFALLWFVGGAAASELRLAVTTSFHNSGLSEVLLPEVKKDIDLDVRLIVVGTGQALKLGRAGDVDAILVHSKSAEEEFVEQGYGTHRRQIMYNDFVLIGPADDPAGVGESQSILDSLQRVREAQSVFVSRGDDSGTHRKEIALWGSLGMDSSKFDATWYRSAGSGMGGTLNTASGMNAYVLADRASWLKFANKGELKILLEGDPSLFNQYAYLPVDPARHKHVAAQEATALENWLVSEKGQGLIDDYMIDGTRLFTANAQ